MFNRFGKSREEKMVMILQQRGGVTASKMFGAKILSDQTFEIFISVPAIDLVTFVNAQNQTQNAYILFNFFFCLYSADKFLMKN